MTLNRKILKKNQSPRKSPRRHNTSLRKKTLIKKLSGDVQFGAASKANVKVVVRIRPHNERELQNGERSILKVVDEHMMIFDPKEEEEDFFFKGARQRTRDFNKRAHKEQKFMFERIFNVESQNQQIFDETTKDVINTVLSGYNCSVFAYGATGAGKTFTMLGHPQLPGITFLTLMELYKRIDELKDEKICEIGVSYLEVYNETVRDLLKPGKLLNVQESGSRVLVPGLSLHKPTGAEDILEMLAFGNKNRSQHPTDANAESSRSHAVFQIFVRQSDKVSGLKSNVSIAKLSMIDLAGSEKGTATGFKGARFREGANINRSLLALGNCINALADGLQHVPYRDSKLTRLLKDSLGGNCCSVMIAAISPSSSSFEDTYNTLRYANRAKTIKTTVKKNLMCVDKHVSEYVEIVEALREEVASLKQKIKTYEEKEEKEKENDHELQMAKEALERQQDLESQISLLQEQLANEKAKSPIKIKTTSYEVCEEELRVQKQLDEISSERKSLRRELLQLEASQRELEIKIHNNNLRLNRMRIVSFASQKLDKSISKCERTNRNLTNRLDQIKKLQDNVERKLEANLDKLHSIQEDLNQWGDGACEPSLPSKSLIDKHQAMIVERDLAQLSEYLKGLVKDSLEEQKSSEQLIGQLLHVVKEFYVQLRANNLCYPEIQSLFEGVIDSMDESKIIWADQQTQNSDNEATSDCDIPALDIDRITLLPILSNTDVSPALPQEPKVFRRSIMKSSKSTSCLPSSRVSSVAQLNVDGSALPSITESGHGVDVSPHEPSNPAPSALSTTFTSCEESCDFNPSPIIGAVHSVSRPRALNVTMNMSSVTSSNGNPLNTTIDIPNKTTAGMNLATLSSLLCEASSHTLKEQSDEPRSLKNMNVTFDGSNGDESKALNEPMNRVSSTSSGVPSQVLVENQEDKLPQRKLFPGKLDNTFSLDNNTSLGCAELDLKSPELASGAGTETKLQRSPLAPLENICPQRILNSIPTIIINDEKAVCDLTKKSAQKKPSLFKTPGKSFTSYKSGFLSTSKKPTASSLRRSQSTSSLASRPSLGGKSSIMSSAFKRKDGVSESAIRFESFLKKNRIKNQENRPPGNSKTYTPTFKSLIHKDRYLNANSHQKSQET